MRRPAGMARNRAPGRRPGDTAHPPLRAGPANAPVQDMDTAALGTVRRDEPRRARGQKTAAVERREASVPRRADVRELICAGTRAAIVRGPLATPGAAAPERLSALRFPHS